jgi:5-methylcytosine-specific restriction endonuclease McrA
MGNVKDIIKSFIEKHKLSKYKLLKGKEQVFESNELPVLFYILSASSTIEEHWWNFSKNIVNNLNNKVDFWCLILLSPNDNYVITKYELDEFKQYIVNGSYKINERMLKEHFKFTDDQLKDKIYLNVFQGFDNISNYGTEGGEKYRNHIVRERCSRLVKEKKAKYEHKCEVCEFVFEDTYGEDFIECHHVKFLCHTGETITELDDLALVCSNCHSMLHRKFDEKYLSIEDLKNKIKKSEKSYY